MTIYIKTPPLEVILIGNFTNHSIKSALNALSNQISEQISQITDFRTTSHHDTCYLISHIFAPKHFYDAQNNKDLLEAFSTNSTKRHVFRHHYLSIADSLNIHNIINGSNADIILLGGGQDHNHSLKVQQDIRHDLYRAFLAMAADLQEKQVIMLDDFCIPEIYDDPTTHKAHWNINITK